MKTILSVLISGTLLLTACSSDPDKQAKKDCEVLQNIYVEGWNTFPNNFDVYQRDQFIFSSSYGSMKDPKVSYLVKQISDLTEGD
jgi:hypothetical protein